MSNFFNYYGEYEDNIYEFNSGLNVIVADNGAGKTKLFSAFCWVLKDEVINSDATGDKNISVDNYKAYMISDKAKNETLTNNEVKCGVRINFSEDHYEYEIEKYFWAKRINDSSPTNPENWFCHSIETKISKKDLILLCNPPYFRTGIQASFQI
ncbi:AAA family ATPase [Sphingobacterium haloxyli]|nr:ATP-binding protein [Sphingobacterium haloxyli]